MLLVLGRKLVVDLARRRSVSRVRELGQQRVALHGDRSRVPSPLAAVKLDGMPSSPRLQVLDAFEFLGETSLLTTLRKELQSTFFESFGLAETLLVVRLSLVRH